MTVVELVPVVLVLVVSLMAFAAGVQESVE